jgi:hypothetical protein
VQGEGALGRASAATFNTPSNVANLAPYGLEPGFYQITVQAANSSGQTSAPAQAQITLVTADLAAVRVFPNPWRSDRHTNPPGITFDDLPVNTTVKLFTVSGHHVKTLNTAGGSAIWDLTNESGDRIASGIYIYLITTDQGGKKRGKLTVIK